MKTYKKIQLPIADDGTVNAPGEIVAVEHFGMNTVTVLVDMSKPHRLAFAEPAQQPDTDENSPAPQKIRGLNVTMKSTETVEPALDTLSYKELQKLAVEYDVKGNLPRDEMEAAIREARRT
jgi:hypothetical protein